VVVRESPPSHAPGPVADLHHVPLAKITLHAHHADRQQRGPAALQRRERAIVGHQRPRPGRDRDALPPHRPSLGWRHAGSHVLPRPTVAWAGGTRVPTPPPARSRRSTPGAAPEAMTVVPPDRLASRAASS